MNITIDNLRKEYHGRTVLSIAGLTLESGEVVGLVGNNGAGKTTLLRLILDLVRASEGKVCIGGNNVADSEEWKISCGAYLDEGFLIDYLTAMEFLSLVGAVRGIGRPELQGFLERMRILLDGDVAPDGKMLIRNLSHGTIQKVGIASALLGEPHIVVLDEPFANLDPTSQSALKEILSEYHRRTGALLLLSSHNLRHVVDICTRIILLEQGIVLRDTPVRGDGTALLAELEKYFDARNPPM